MPTRAWPYFPAQLAVAMCGSQGPPLNTTEADGGDASNSQNPPPTAYTDPFAGAPAYTPWGKGDNAHNEGRSCMSDDCHGSSAGGGGETAFLVAGTVYQDSAGTIPAQGVEVRVVDTKNNAASTYTGSNGNFYIHLSGTSVTFPGVVGVRDATATRPMITQLTGTMGSCAQTGCHTSTDAGGYYPIHIP